MTGRPDGLSAEPPEIAAIRQRNAGRWYDRRPLDTESPERRALWQAQQDIETLLSRDSRPVGEGLTPARFWQLALAKSIDGLVVGDAWEAAAAIKGRLDSRGVVLAVDPVANPIGLSTDQPASTEVGEDG